MMTLGSIDADEVDNACAPGLMKPEIFGALPAPAWLAASSQMLSIKTWLRVSARRTSSHISSKWPRLLHVHRVWRDNCAKSHRGEKRTRCLQRTFEKSCQCQVHRGVQASCHLSGS